jgi:hypothetical protein
MTESVRDKPHAPMRPKDRQRWIRIWNVIKAYQHRSCDSLEQWIGDMHPELHMSQRTLGKIIKAGNAGELNPSNASKLAKRD